MATLFTINFRGQCHVVEGPSADVTILDLDGALTADRASLLKGIGIDPARTICISDDDVHASSLRVLKKPVRIDALKQAILQAAAGQAAAAAAPLPEPASGQLQSAVAEANVPARKAPEHAAGKFAVFQPGDFFVGWLQQQLQGTGPGETLWLSTWHGKVLVFQPKKNLLHTDLTSHQIRNLASTPVPRSLRDASEIQRRPFAPTSSEIDGFLALPLDHFMWELAYLTSRGRLPEGFDPAESHYLAKWPNFTRLPRMPNGMRIAAIWAGAPQKLDGIAEKLGIPREEVYAFYYAGHVLGLAGVSRSESRRVVQSRGAQQGPARSMLSALLRHVTAPIRAARAADQLTLDAGEP